jgi:oligosaccharyltransferase complex subunit alpha (ribophorin I)
MVQVQLKDALAPKATVTLKVHLVFGHTMEPYPRAIAQSERQLVRYRDNHFAFSPYTTNTATTVVKLTSASIQTSSQLDPTNVKGDTITYGPYEKLKPFSHSPMMIHFENNKPFLTVARLNREIEVSHWGYINIEENHHWRNDGAELKGGFSRYEYQINPAAQGHAAIKQVDINIPRHADDVYYRDAIGNISTSHHFKTKLNIIPRFPLFGGWQTKFCMGYVTPVQDFLRQSLSDSSRFTLNITFGTAFDDDVIVDNQRVKIMLPEGATDIKVTTPFPVKESRENKITYLTWNGRPVVILEKTNLINEMNKQYFQVTYKFSSTDAYRQPLLLVGFLFAVFFALIVLSRFNPSILPDDEKAKEELLNRVRGHVKKYKELLETRSDAHQTLQRELERHVTSGGLSNFSQEKGLATRRLDDALNVATNIFTEVEKISGDLAERIRYVRYNAKALAKRCCIID